MTDATIEHRGEPTTAASLNQYNFNSILNMCPYTHRYVYFPPLVKEAFFFPADRDHYKNSQLVKIQRITDIGDPGSN